jgi:hypothetical protein
MAKVYMISCYDEDGSTDVRATLDKGKVRGLLETHPELHSGISEEYDKRLTELLAADKPVDGADLGRGWGGFQLHIIELE